MNGNPAINWNRRPPIADAIEEAAELVTAWPLFQESGCEDRVLLAVADKLARFLDELLHGAVGVDDEGRLGLTNYQSAANGRPVNILPLTVESRSAVNEIRASVESLLNILGKLSRSDAAVNTEPLTVNDDLSHETSPSVGAPNSAGVGASEPTEGEPQTRPHSRKIPA